MKDKDLTSSGVRFLWPFRFCDVSWKKEKKEEYALVIDFYSLALGSPDLADKLQDE